jgi:hypothetical protein
MMYSKKEKRTKKKKEGTSQKNEDHCDVEN